jgi:hypothetical protein
MRSCVGVRLRVRLRIQDSGTRRRAASSPESISSVPLFSVPWDISRTSDCLVAILVNNLELYRGSVNRQSRTTFTCTVALLILSAEFES